MRVFVCLTKNITALRHFGTSAPLSVTLRSVTKRDLNTMVFFNSVCPETRFHAEFKRGSFCQGIEKRCIRCDTAIFDNEDRMIRSR